MGRYFEIFSEKNVFAGFTLLALSHPIVIWPYHSMVKVLYHDKQGK